MSVAERFIDRIETQVAIGLGKIDAAEKRGHFTDDDFKCLNDIEWSKLPVNLTAYEMAARHDGVRVRSRSELIPNVLACKGLHVSNSGPRPEIYVYGAIGESHGGISAIDFRSQLSRFGADETIDLHVHSPGGSFTEAVAISSLIRDRPGRVNGFVDGEACSAGSLILMPCDAITMSAASTLMIHLASLEPQGSWSEADLAQALKLMRDTNQKLVELYSPRWKGTEKELRTALESETYFTAAEAVARGLADYISASVKVAAYQVATGTSQTPGYSIAASKGANKKFRLRRAGLAIWQMAADDMRAELARN